ncbi:type II toxin-antitoxin system HipA family toxin [Paracoccus laeviglucosivorans]|uniref:Serine/threonine-protein kinase HipA n=1 Tax=Paracoccus laeviglucosivorans TaxID=1197861 RepID=A0A521F078_9RHOB|nr:type II toxin-antitoxin system HipA family toxin [Paracoccus laeviglucosivorans]SMO89537.1 serine/threonine-protein kinase HipA [Paracoccus laeviglucosivorans]
MGRRRLNQPLAVHLNGRQAGTLLRDPDGATSFAYHPDWLGWEHGFRLSLSLPLNDQVQRGPQVLAVFDNLLPDNGALRRALAERMGAGGDDPFSLLSAIGRDCVGAMQFLPQDEDPGPAFANDSEPLDDAQIGQMLRGLGRHPLGLERDQPFRISVAGAQEKTALLWDDGWRLPLGMTATTHILKTRMGVFQHGIDMTTSLENELLCLRLAAAFGFDVPDARIVHFDGTDALAVRRFDRSMSRGRRLRLPQEDLCQALGVPSVRKYEQDGGPGISEALALLGGATDPMTDRETFLAAQMFFWMIGATDGHAKNFSIFLAPRGFRMTPLYDILSAEPARASGQLRQQQMQMAMAVSGASRHYRIDQISPRHFVQTARSCGLGQAVIDGAFARLTQRPATIFDDTAAMLGSDFPQAVLAPILAGAQGRWDQLRRFAQG